MSNIPIYYDHANALNSANQPNVFHVRDTALAYYFKRGLLQDVLSIIDAEIPSNWPLNYFLYILSCAGFLCVFNTDKYGVIPQFCTLTGYNVFYQPRGVLVANPLIRTKNELLIGRDCEIVNLQPDYGSVMDMVNFYGDLMAQTAEAMGVNLANTRVAYVMGCDNKGTSETAKAMFDQIFSGNPAVFTDTKMFDQKTGKPKWELFNRDVKAGFIAPELLDMLDRIRNEFFFQEIGFGSTSKREREITHEAATNSARAQSRVGLWDQCLKDSADRVNKMFGINIKLGIKKEVLDYGTNQSTANGSLSV